MKRKILSILLVLVLALSFSLVMEVPVIAQESITIDGVISVGEWNEYLWFTDKAGNKFFGGYPEFTYYKTNDEQNLYFGVIVNDPTPFWNANDDLWLAFRDSEDNYKEFRKGYTLIPEEMGKYSEKPFPSSYQPLPEGVEFGCSIDESHIYYEWKIPLAFLGVSPGDTIKYLTSVREYPKPEGISSPINYHPEVTTYFTYSDRSQFGDLTLWAPSPEPEPEPAEPVFVRSPNAFDVFVRWGYDSTQYHFSGNNTLRGSIEAAGRYNNTRYMLEIPAGCTIEQPTGERLNVLFLKEVDGDVLTFNTNDVDFSEPCTLYIADIDEGGRIYQDYWTGDWIGGTWVEVGTFTSIVDGEAHLD